MLALGVAPFAQAQGVFPSKPIRIMVGFPPGGSVDIAARLIADYISKIAGQPVIVDNRPGAGGIIAATAVAKATADGHTLLLSIQYPVINAQALLRSLPYDPNKDFTFVTPILTGQVVLSVHKSIPVANLAELVGYARRTPGFALGSWAPGSQGHLMVDAINQHFGINITHVAYKGEGPMTQDIMGGQIPGGTSSLVSIQGAIKTGQIRAIAVTSGPRGGRMKQLPEVLTFAEQGMNEPSVTLSGWIGVLTTAGTPRATVAKLNEWVRAALAQSEIRVKLESFGLEVVSSTPEEFDASFRAEAPLWIKAINATGVRLD
jgi:tripartite-type tricarboxylate transporter receptor subunit TctC